MRQIRSMAITATLLFSSGLTIAGFVQMLRFAGNAGEQVSAPPQWPTSTHVVRSSIRSTLLLFAHPFCSCSKATIGELAQVLERQDKGTLPDIVILFFKPPGISGWKPGDLWNQAAAIPGATVGWDAGGLEAKRFSARTSGFIALYDRDGVARFQGGITGARGQFGDNYGARQLSRVLHFGRSERQHSLVFGCALLGPSPASGFAASQ